MKRERRQQEAPRPRRPRRRARARARRCLGRRVERARGRPRRRSRRSAGGAGRSCAARPAARRGRGAAGRPKRRGERADQPVDRRAFLGGRGQVEAAQPGALLVAALAEDGVDQQPERRGQARDLGGEAEDLGAGRRAPPRPPCAGRRGLRAARPALASSRPTAPPSTLLAGAKVAPQTCSRSAVDRPPKNGSKPLTRSALVSIR